MTFCNIPWTSHSFPSACFFFFSIDANIIRPLLEIAKNEGVSSGGCISLSQLQSGGKTVYSLLFSWQFSFVPSYTLFSFPSHLLFSPLSPSSTRKQGCTGRGVQGRGACPEGSWDWSGALRGSSLTSDPFFPSLCAL